MNNHLFVVRVREYLDGRHLMNAGIPTHGTSGTLAIPGEANAHGLNENIRVKSLYEGRDFLEGVVRAHVK